MGTRGLTGFAAPSGWRQMYRGKEAREQAMAHPVFLPSCRCGSDGQGKSNLLGGVGEGVDRYHADWMCSRFLSHRASSCLLSP